LRKGRRMSRVEPHWTSQPEVETKETTAEIPQNECHHPRTQRARRNFWNANAPTVKQIIDKVKKVSRLKKKKKNIADPTKKN
jgi:hypothetical protein